MSELNVMRADGTPQGAEECGGGEATVERGSRRPYAPPRLEVHGELAELTRFGGSQAIDSGANSLGNLV